MRAVVADVLILVGLVVMTIGVYGVVRFPDVFTQLHAASKAAFLGVLSLLAAAAIAGDGPTVTRALLVGVLLTVTTPVGAHVIAQAALRRGEAADAPAAGDPIDRWAQDGPTSDAHREGAPPSALR